MKNVILCAAALLSTTPGVRAAPSILHDCKAEIKKFACDAKSESYAYSCLKKYREPRTKDKGFRSVCYKAYAAYEKETGQTEKIESHQVEHPEHTE